jgi:hypothetical protein
MNTSLFMIWLVCGFIAVPMIIKTKGFHFTPILACLVFGPIALAIALYSRQKDSAANAAAEREQESGPHFS